MPRNPNKTDYSRGFPPCFSAFESLRDPRSGGNTKHHFGGIIFMAFTSILCGVSTYEMMEEFCESNEDWFSKWLDLPHGTPCANTFSRVFEAIEPEHFAECVAECAAIRAQGAAPGHIAIDGKALRGSKTTEDRHIHTVSAWACQNGLTLAQTFVDDKSNEITAIPELMKMLNLEKSVVTLDAMGAQTDIAETITAKGGDYIISVKANQPQLFSEIRERFESFAKEAARSESQSQELSRNREEWRRTVVCHELEWMTKQTRKRWSGLASVVKVERRTVLEDGSTRSEQSYYMSSLKETKADEMQAYIRNHWSIENSCHWVMDVVFREDSSQVSNRNAAKNLSITRRIALNALKAAPEISRRRKPASITKKQMRAAHNHHYREQCLSLV